MSIHSLALGILGYFGSITVDGGRQALFITTRYFRRYSTGAGLVAECHLCRQCLSTKCPGGFDRDAVTDLFDNLTFVAGEMVIGCE